MDRIAIIGASYLQAPLVAKARDLGFETHVFAWEEGAVAKSLADRFYPISITEKESILEVLRGLRPSGVVSIASDLATNTVNYLAAELGLVGNSEESTILTTDKLRMRERLTRSGLPCPGFRRFSGGSQIGDMNLRYPLIVKPSDRSGSRGVTKVMAPKEIPEAIHEALAHAWAKEVVIEEFLPGLEISVEMISWEGRHYHLATTDKETTGEPHFVEKGHHQPTTLPPHLEERAIKVTRAALDALEVEFGASHTELKIDDRGEIGIIEVGSRMGGDFIGADLVPLSCGFDFVKAVIEISTGVFTVPRKDLEMYSGVQFVCPTQGGRVSEVRDRTGDCPEVIRSDFRLAVGDTVKPVEDSSQRYGYLLYQSAQREFRDVSKSLYQLSVHVDA